MTNSLYRPISKGLPGVKIPLASDVAQFTDLLNGVLDAGVILFASPIATLSTGSIALALASGGTLGIGVYRYKFTFVTGLIQADGTPIIAGETPGSATLTITTTAGNQKVTISGLPAIGTWPVTAIGIRIYRTLVGGVDGTQKLVTTLYTNYLRTTFVTSYLDGIADGSLTTAVPFANTTGVTIPYVDAINTALVAHEADYTEHVPYGGATTGTANTYVLAAPTITALSVGMAVSVKFNVDSTAASTLNWNGKGAKGIKKSNGTDVTNLKATGIYTLRYDGTNFILQGEGGSGNALASNLLSGKTASTDAGDIVGTMVNNTANAVATSRDGTTTANRIYMQVPIGFWDGTKNVYFDDANWLAANIPNGEVIFGLTGTGANVKRFATGTVTTSPNLVISGLAFTPSLVMAYLTLANANFGSALIMGDKNGIVFLRGGAGFTGAYVDETVNGSSSTFSGTSGVAAAWTSSGVTLGFPAASQFKWYAFE